MLFDFYDRVRIISLKHRTDRRADMRRQLAKVGRLNDPKVSFFDAISADEPGLFASKGCHGCFLSHMNVLIEAAAAGESVLVLEDDCDFAVPAALDVKVPADCDVYWGGYVASDPSNPHDSDIIGAHCVGFSARAAAACAAYMQTFFDPDFVGDPRAASEPGYDPNKRPVSDGAYVWFRRAHPEMVTVFDQVAYQRPSRTDIGDQRWFDRTPILRDLADMARRAKHRIRPSTQMKNASFD